MSLGLLNDPRTHYHDTELLVAHELHQPRDDASFHYNVNTVIVTVREVGDCPACIRQDVLIAEVEQLDQRGKHLRERQLQHISHLASIATPFSSDAVRLFIMEL